MKIVFQEVSKSFDKRSNAVDGLNLTIEDGELVVLLGPSGCGKSTTMQMLAGIYKPTSGTIYFDHQPVNDLEPKDREIGMVFQSYALYPHMTVLENIEFPLKQMKIGKTERRTRANQAMEMVQLGHLAERKPSELSGGQQQRVAFARAIVKKPKLLLLDEPLSNLDARLKIDMREEIRRLQKELGITTLMVTHDQEEAMTMADRVAVIQDGRLVQYSTPEELYHNPRNHFVAHFIGTPPMNFLEGTWIKEQEVHRFLLDREAIEFNADLSAFALQEGVQEVAVGIRPHDLRLDGTGEFALQGVVQLVEPLGHSTLVSVKTRDALLRLIAEPRCALQRGEQVRVTASMQALHLFDGKSGHSLKR